ncbi:hypothetical protein A2U01_0000908 [Trifolium medium]|uniref:Uncharacterized protein n=1 Tax=Trifolium medium TaxID=97028 RepID=A0A392LYU6_9FABA|nr:hypothetical protein [Trifolium medium]
MHSNKPLLYPAQTSTPKSPPRSPTQYKSSSPQCGYDPDWVAPTSQFTINPEQNSFITMPTSEFIQHLPTGKPDILHPDVLSESDTGVELIFVV